VNVPRPGLAPVTSRSARHAPDVAAHQHRSFSAHSGARSGFFILNMCLIIITCAIVIYFRWNDLGDADFQYYSYGGVDFLSHPKLYDRIYVNKPPLAFLMYIPVSLIPVTSRVAIYFGTIIAIEAVLLRMLLRQLRFDEAACLGGTIFFLTATLFKSQLDFVSLSHLTNLLILGACIAAVRGSTQGVILSGLLIAASFYIRQNNLILGLYPIILGRFLDPKTLIVYATSMFGIFLALFGLFCLISNIDLFIYTTFLYPFKYVDMGIGAPPLGFGSIAWIFAQNWRKWLLLFLGIWCVAAWTRVRSPVSGSQMLLLFGVAFIAVVAPKKAFDHYQGYLLIWFGLLGAWVVYVLTSRFFRRWQSGLVWLGTGCAVLFAAAVAQRELKLSGELESARNRLDPVLSEIRSALDSRPGHPTLQTFDAIYTLHETYDGLLLMLTGAKPASPLIFTLLFSEESALTLPPVFRNQWALLAQQPPDVVLLKDVGETSEFTDMGANFAPLVHQFLKDHGYRERALSNKVTIAERPYVRPQ
jgi:hypothetical protein